jgi:hypothetical protein
VERKQSTSNLKEVMKAEEKERKAKEKEIKRKEKSSKKEKKNKKEKAEKEVVEREKQLPVEAEPEKSIPDKAGIKRMLTRFLGLRPSKEELTKRKILLSIYENE